MSALQIQVIRSIIDLPEDKLQIIFEKIQQITEPIAGMSQLDELKTLPSPQAGGIQLGHFNGMQYILPGHDIDECNAEIAAMFGVNEG